MLSMRRMSMRIEAEHHPDALPQLVGEHHRRVGLFDHPAQLAQGLAHQPRLHPHRGVTHVPLDLRTRHQRRHAVNHHHVHSSAAHQRLGDLQRLLPRVRLRDVELIDVHARALCILRIERMLHVDIGAHATQALRLGDDVLRQGGLAGGLGAVDFGYASAGNATHSQGQVQGQRPGGDGGNSQVLCFAQAHQGAISETLRDLVNRSGEDRQPLFNVIRLSLGPSLTFRHLPTPLSPIVFYASGLSIAQVFYVSSRLDNCRICDATLLRQPTFSAPFVLPMQEWFLDA